MPEDEVLECKSYEAQPLYWWHSRCGKDRDCINDDRPNPFSIGWCNAMDWCSRGNGRTVEVWEPHNARRMFTIRESTVTFARQSRCAATAARRAVNPFSPAAGDDRSTIAIPGLSDILRIPGIDSPATRRERMQRFRAGKSPTPEFLQPFVKLLNKLDDAQDLLYTALVIGVWVAKFFGARMIPGLGWLLAINDLLNAGT